jgi:hypothetical protein
MRALLSAWSFKWVREKELVYEDARAERAENEVSSESVTLIFHYKDNEIWGEAG